MEKKAIYAVISWTLFLYLLFQAPLPFIINIILILITGFIALYLTSKILIKNNKHLSEAATYTLLTLAMFSFGIFREPVVLMPSLLLLLGILYHIYKGSKENEE